MGVEDEIDDAELLGVEDGDLTGVEELKVDDLELEALGVGVLGGDDDGTEELRVDDLDADDEVDAEELRVEELRVEDLAVEELLDRIVEDERRVELRVDDCPGLLDELTVLHLP